MERRKNISIVACAGSVMALLMIAALMLSGCFSQSSAETDGQAQAREYLASVNQVMDDLDACLADFESTVLDGDVATISTAVKGVSDARKALESIDVPDGMQDIQEGYLDGSQALVDALDSYIGLFSDIEGAADETFDYASYEYRIEEIQALYDEGLSKLADADTAAEEALS